MTEPRREQLSGDEAHDRVRAMLAETVDTELWHAQRVMQAGSTAAVDLSGCDALSRALDAAAGDAAAPNGTETLLIDRIDDEYGHYFTPTGRITGVWKTAVDALADTEAEVARCQAAVAEVDERVHRHGELTDRLADLERRRKTADARHEAAKDAAGAIAALTDELRAAQADLGTAQAAENATTTAQNERVWLCTEVDNRTATLTDLQTEAADAASAEAVAREAAGAAGHAAEHAAQDLAAAEQRAETARRICDQLANREETDRLAERVTKIDAAQRDSDQVAAELSATVVTEALLGRIEDSAAALDRAEASLVAVSATVEFSAAAATEVVVGGERVSLSAGQDWSTPITAATEAEIPGLLSMRIGLGDTARDAESRHAAAQRELGAALEAAAVTDLPAARRADHRRREMQFRRDQLAAALGELCGDDRVDELKLGLERLRSDQPETAGDVTAEAARAERDTAEAARLAVAAECEHRRSAAGAAAKRLTEAATRASLVGEKVANHRGDLDALAQRLTGQRAVASDADLSLAAHANREATESSRRRAAEVSERRATAAPEAVTTELTQASEAAEALGAQHAETVRSLQDVVVELELFGTQGRQSGLDDAKTAREHASAEHTSIGRRARAADLLRTVMTRHRDDTRRRYVEPFRTELERLGRPVFGPTFEVDVDTDLKICTRTLDGRTVAYESLSGGAREQLGILARLAGAALVAKEDTVPVVIDDALGFTDPARLASMGEVFGMVGADGQVIVLTCTPARYDGIDGAERIAL